MDSFRKFFGNTLTTGREGGPGVFYGNRVKKPDIIKELPLDGPGVLVIPGTENVGDAQDAPLCDALHFGWIRVPPHLAKLLMDHDVEEDTEEGKLTLDIVGILALIHQGIKIVHFPSKHDPKMIVSLDLREVDATKLLKELVDSLQPKGTSPRPHNLCDLSFLNQK